MRDGVRRNAVLRPTFHKAFSTLKEYLNWIINLCWFTRKDILRPHKSHFHKRRELDTKYEIRIDVFSIFYCSRNPTPTYDDRLRSSIIPSLTNDSDYVLQTTCSWSRCNMVRNLNRQFYFNLITASPLPINTEKSRENIISLELNLWISR